MRQRVVCVESPDYFVAELERVAMAEGDELFVLSPDERHLGRQNVIAVDPRSDHARAVTEIRRIVGRPDAVLTSQEMFLTQAASLADAFGVARDPVAAVSAARDKARMKREWLAAGIGTPRGKFFSTAADLQEDLAMLDFPVIAKPSAGYASCGVRKIDSAVELIEHLRSIFLFNSVVVARERLPETGFIVEEFIDGPEFSIDTIWFAGQPLCDGIMSRNKDEGPFFPDRLYYVDPNLPEPMAQAICEISYRAVRALGISYGATHTEVRFRGDTPFVLEATNRPGAGGMFYSIFNSAFGMDFHRLYYLAAICPDPAELARRAGPSCRQPPDPSVYSFWYSVPPRGSGMIREISGLANLSARPEVDLCVCYKRPGTMLYPVGLEPEYFCTLTGSYRRGPDDPALEDYVTGYDDVIEVVF